MTRRKSRFQTREVRWKEVSIAEESSYIVARAMAGDARVVSLQPLAFFSTSTGDAWVLDAVNGLAPLAAGTRLPFAITETTARFAIEWAGRFRIEGEQMIFTDSAGTLRTIIGYPTREITTALDHARP